LSTRKPGLPTQLGERAFGLVAERRDIVERSPDRVERGVPGLVVAREQRLEPEPGPRPIELFVVAVLEQMLRELLYRRDGEVFV
jgi:hypothetical protein